jgi:hypothetical protein
VDTLLGYLDILAITPANKKAAMVQQACGLAGIAPDAVRGIVERRVEAVRFKRTQWDTAVATAREQNVAEASSRLQQIAEEEAQLRRKLDELELERKGKEDEVRRENADLDEKARRGEVALAALHTQLEAEADSVKKVFA